MSTPEPTPAAPSPYAAPSVAAAAPFDRWRWLLSGVIGILGGYLTVASVSGQLTMALSGRAAFPFEVGFLLVAQAVFALAVTAFAFMLAPGKFGRRVLAVVLFVVIVVLLVAFLVARNYGGLRVPGPGFLVVTNPYWIVLLAGAVGWLIAAGSRPLAYLSLLLTFIVMPLGFVFAMNNISYGISALVQYGLCLAIAVAILIVSRPALRAVGVSGSMDA
jgi:hypothetical protein